MRSTAKKQANGRGRGFRQSAPTAPLEAQDDKLSSHPSLAGPPEHAATNVAKYHRRSTTQPDWTSGSPPIDINTESDRGTNADPNGCPTHGNTASSSFPTGSGGTRKHHLGQFDSVWEYIQREREEKGKAKAEHAARRAASSHTITSARPTLGRVASGPVTRLSLLDSIDARGGVKKDTYKSTPNRSNYKWLSKDTNTDLIDFTSQVLDPSSTQLRRIQTTSPVFTKKSSYIFPPLPHIPFTKSQWAAQRERRALQSLLLKAGASNSQFGAHIFVDHSNIYHGASRLLGKTRFCYTRLFSLIEDLVAKSPDGDRLPVIKRVMAASHPVPEECVSTGREFGYDVYVLERQQKEMFVDELLHMKISESLLDYGNGILCLVTGDGNRSEFVTGFGHHVARALARNWQVKIISWSQSLSHLYTKSFYKHPNFEVLLLDDLVSKIISIPRRRSLSQEMLPGRVFRAPQSRLVRSDADDLLGAVSDSAISTSSKHLTKVHSGSREKALMRTPRGTKLRHLQARQRMQSVR